MKKYVSLFICFVLSLLVLSGCGMDFNPETYVSEAKMVTFRNLVDGNQHFYNDVFVLGHLEIDEEKVFEKDGKKYAPVTDSRYTSYEDLKTGLLSVYTKECAEEILEKYDFYADVDGVFCYDMADADNTRKGKKWVRTSKWEPEIEEIGDGYYQVEYKFYAGKSDEIDEFRMIETTNGYKLKELQYVT